MNLSRAIIHEIIKQPQVNGSTSFLSQILLPVNANTIRLAQSLNNSFSRDDSSYGDFETNNNNFYDEFTLHQNTLTDQSFISYTQNATTDLSNTLAVTFLAKGGFFVFCEYELNGIRFIGVYLVRDVEGVLFNKDNVNHTFQINQVR